LVSFRFSFDRTAAAACFVSATAARFECARRVSVRASTPGDVRAWVDTTAPPAAPSGQTVCEVTTVARPEVTAAVAVPAHRCRATFLTVTLIRFAWAGVRRALAPMSCAGTAAQAADAVGTPPATATRGSSAPAATVANRRTDRTRPRELTIDRS